MTYFKSFFISFLFINLALVNIAEAADFRTNLGTGFSGGPINSIRFSSSSDIYIVGAFSFLNGNIRNHMVKLNASGTENTLFATNLGTGFNLNLGDTAVQNNGKTIVGGLFTSLNGNTRNRLVRLNADGTEDLAFYANLGSGVNDSFVNRIALQSDGKILVGGRFSSFASSSRNGLFRLNADGTEDAAFYTNLGTGFAPSGSREPNVIRVQTDGKIIVGGDFNALNGNTRHNLVRLNSDGTEDTVFYANTPSAIDDYVYDVAIDQTGNMIVGGSFTGSGLRKYLTRLNASGTEDTAFYTNLGSSFNGLVIRVAIQPDGKIIVAGNFTTFNGNTRNNIVRLNPDGTEDTTFATNIGTGFDQNVLDAYLQTDGKIVVGGAFSNFNGRQRSFIVRLNPDGTEDADLIAPVITINGAASSTVAMGSIYTDAGATALDNIDGNVTSSITATSTVNTNYSGAQTVIYRASDSSGNVAYATRTVNVLLPASPDGFYKRLGTGFNGQITSAALQLDGKIIIGGTYTNFFSTSSIRNSLIRLNASGAEDTTFYNNSKGVSNLPNSIILKSNNNIVVGGGIISLGTSTRNMIFSLNPDGTEDTAFYTNLGTGFNTAVNSISLQSDGKLLVAGNFTSLNGNVRNHMTRLNASGTEDTAFYTNLGTGFNKTIYSTAIQGDGKIVAIFQLAVDFNGNPRNGIVRINPDGTEDTAFYTNLGTAFNNNSASNAYIQSNGKILVGGDFISFNGNGRNRLVRLNADGIEDTAFYTNLGTGFNSEVKTIKQQPNGKILVGGSFTSFNGNTRNRLVRLNADGTEDVVFYNNLGSAFNGFINTMVVQPDGKILIVGNFTAFNGDTHKNIVRLNSDGTEDLDVTAPVITVLGSNPASVTVGSAYVDAGSSALDAVDGDVTASTTATSTVNINTIGAYTVVYTARDISGNLSYATRTVNVIAVVSSGGGGGGGGRSSGGGGGGGYYIPPVVAQTSTTTKATTTSTTTKANTTSNNLIIKSTSTTIVGRLTKVLSPRVNDTEVRTLQRFLNSNGYIIARSGPGSKGKESIYMGQSTVNALKKFQRDNKISPATGYTGVATRNKINSKLLTQIITPNTR